MLNDRQYANPTLSRPPVCRWQSHRGRWLGILLAAAALVMAMPGSGLTTGAQAAEEGGGHASGGGSSGGGHDAGGGASGGGHEAGGESSGGGHTGGGSSGGGHEESGGGCGGGGGGCSDMGGDKGRHGLGGGFGKRARNRGFNLDAMSGHVSGEHGQSGSGRGAQHGISGSHYFGAGWLGGSRHVPEGIGGEPQSGFGEPGYAGLGGGGRGFGYWGGRRTDDGGGGGDDGTDNPPATGGDTLAGVTSGTGGPVIRSSDSGQELSCERFASEDLAGKRRLMGKNLTRLKVAGHLIAPTYTSNIQRYAGFAERHLSYYQAEAAKSRPDALLLGTYLGLIAEKPVNASLVQNIDHTLCVTLPAQDTNRIVDVAEGQRQHLKAFVGTGKP